MVDLVEVDEKLPVRFVLGKQSSLAPERGLEKELLELREDGNERFDIDEIDPRIRLMYLVTEGDLEGIKELLDSGTNVNFKDIDDRTALHVAACQGYVDVAKFLLENGAEVDPKDRWGSTMVKYFNEKSHLSGNIPLGSFNAMFNFTGAWQVDAAATKSVAMVGYVIPLFHVELAKFDLVIRDEGKRAVSYSWDPASLARILKGHDLSGVLPASLAKLPYITYIDLFANYLNGTIPKEWSSTKLEVFFIENYSTHIVTSATVGGRDVVYIRQHQSSPLSITDIESYVSDIRDQRFSDPKTQSSFGAQKCKDKDVTVIFRRRGGDDIEQSHSKWAETVETAK